MSGLQKLILRIKPAVVDCIQEQAFATKGAIIAASGVKSSQWYDVSSKGASADTVITKIQGIAERFGLRIPIYCFLDYYAFEEQFSGGEIPAKLLELAFTGNCLEEHTSNTIGQLLRDDEHSRAFLKLISRQPQQASTVPFTASVSNDLRPLPLLPFRNNPYFTGRAVWLDRLHILTQKGHPTFAISGLGGIGKTQLVLEYAHRYSHCFKQVFWSPASSKADLQNGFIEIADHLNLAFDNTKSSSAVKAVKQWMATNADWLLILDNADEPTLLDEFVPNQTRGAILMTSRARVFDNLGLVERLDLTEFELGETVAFLKLRSRKDFLAEAEEQAIHTLHEELGGLPLALEQAAAYVVEKQISDWQNYLIEFRKHRIKMLEKQMPVAGSYPRSVATTWLMNFAEVRKISEASADLLRFTAFLQDSAPIPFTYIIKAQKSMPVALRMLLESAEVKPLAVLEALAPLARFSLVRVEPIEQTYTMHLLVQEIVRDLDEA